MTEPDSARDELRAAARDMLSTVSTSAAVRGLAQTPSGFDASLWQHFAEMGWPGIEIPEHFGGAGARFGDLAVVLIELGHHLASNALPGTAVLGAAALAAVPDHHRARHWLPRIASGQARAAAALVSGDGEPGWAGFTAVRGRGDAWEVTGTSSYVADGQAADLLILRAHKSDRTELLLAVEPGVPGLLLNSAPMLDITRRFTDVAASALRVSEADVLAEGEQGALIVRRLLDRAALSSAADALGVAERALDLTVDYAKTREQFERRIGSFQAVKHRCADMFIRVETARVALQDALDCLDENPDDACAAVSRAKAYTCDAAAQVTEDGVDMHGGIGFTWEHDMHLLVKRARLDQALYGDSLWHRRRAADFTFARSPV